MDLQDREIGKQDDAAGSGGMKIVVKIKHPSTEDAQIRAHQCKECNKSFSSGKALGGHMSSAHVQANKDYSYKKLKSRMPKTGQYRDSGLHVCMVCRKSFPSLKSLFGHMRCHPDRVYRGMQPPSAYVSSEEEPGLGYYESPEEDTVNSLKAWALKAKRGRSARTKSSSEEEEEELSAGHQLLRLLKRLPADSDDKEIGVVEEVNIKKRKDVDDHDILQSLVCKKQRASNNHPLKIWNNADDVEKSDINGKLGESESESEADLLLGAICVLANGKRDLTATPEKHICSICNKVFPSHQALGGHKSSHNKFKMIVVNTEDDIIAPKNNNSNSSIGGLKNVKSDQQTQVGDSSHVCPICERVFPTVRALGGHRKIHKEKVVSVRDFDLNMVPDDGDGDGDDGGLIIR